MSTQLQDTAGRPLIPGRLYCLALQDEVADVLRYGSLAWYGSDGKFYDANYPDTEGAEIDEDFDALVLQVGDVNPAYIFS